MALAVFHCSCSPALQHHPACLRTSFSICFLRRQFTLSEPTGLWATASFYHWKQQNGLLAVRADATTATETETSTSALADAAKVVSLAREAVLAASYVFTLSNIHDYKFESISEADLLRLQRARLSALELNLGDLGENRLFQTSHEEGASSAADVSDSGHHHGADILDKEYTSNDENVVVRSTRREERVAKRKYARRKSVPLPVATRETWKTPRRLEVSGPRSTPDPIHLFLVSNGSRKPKLLTAAEEVNLSHKIQDLLVMESVRKTVHKQLGREPTLSEWANSMHMKLREFSRRLIESQRCKDTMIKCNLRLVISVAKKFEGGGLSLEDLVQEGSQGLIRGCEKFDPNKGFRFSTYAHWWIMQAVTKAIIQKSRLVRLPVYLLDTLLCIRKTKQVLKLKYGCAPSDVDVARHAGITMERLRTVTKASKFCKSTDKPLGKESNLLLADLLTDTLHPSECKFMRRLLKEDVDAVLRSLKPKEREVIRLRYGLDDGGRRRTLEEVGKMYHVTRERIRQIECQAMIKLKDPERSEALKDLLPEM